MLRVPEIPSLFLEAEGAPAPRLPPAPETWTDGSGEVFAYGFTRGTKNSVLFPGLATFSFDHRKGPVTVFPVPPLRREAIADAFERSLLPVVWQARGGEAVHASAILSGGGVVGFCARSGTGKSTLAAALVERGYALWADDALTFDVSGSTVKTHALPFRARLRRDAQALLATPETTASGLTRLSALVVLERQRAPGVEVGKLRASVAFASLLEHAYCLRLDRPERKARMLRHYLELVGALAVFRIRFQPDLESLRLLVDEVERLLDRVRS